MTTINRATKHTHCSEIRELIYLIILCSNFNLACKSLEFRNDLKGFKTKGEWG